jgi:hypothetical protein
MLENPRQRQGPSTEQQQNHRLAGGHNSLRQFLLPAWQIQMRP